MTHDDIFISGARLKQGRYELVELLGEGGFGATWAAQDHERGERVAIKRLELRRATDWKAFELFEREASVLQSIFCEEVPDYIDYFEDSQGAFCLVQQLAAGHTIAHWVRELGWRPNNEELIAWLSGMLEVLEVLHGYRPAIIHRDIKPENVLRTEDGAISVVDFGSVKSSTLTQEEGRVGGSTMVGTFGYMAPEQLRGVANPATDLYGLAMTALFIMTHREPGELPTSRLKIDLGQVFGDDWAQRPLLVWLDGMIEPAEEDRFVSAVQARQALLHRNILFKHVPPDSGGDAPKEELLTEIEEPQAQFKRLSMDELDAINGLNASSPGCGVVSVLGFSAVMGALVLFPIDSGIILGVIIALPVLTLMFSLSFAPEHLLPAPESHIHTVKSDVKGLAMTTIVLLVAVGAFGGARAPLWATLVCIAMALMALGLAAMYRSTWLALTRQVALEQQLGIQMPLVPRNDERDVRVSLRSYRRGESVEAREVSTFTARTLGALAAASLALGFALDVIGVRPPYDYIGVGCGMLALAATLGAVWIGLRHIQQRSSLHIDRVQKLIKGRTHGGAWHTFHFEQVRGWEVFTRVEDDDHRVVVRLTVAHGTGAAIGELREVEVFGVIERSEVLAVAQVVMWQGLLDELIKQPEGSGVVLDFAQAEQMRQADEPVKVIRRPGSAW